MSLPDTPFCPYCNAATPLPPGTRTGQRVVCPRCGESFPWRGAVWEDGTLPPPRTAESLPAVPFRPPAPVKAAPRRPSNALVAVAVLGGMALLALVAMTFALQTVGVRRDHDALLPKSRAVAIPVYLRVLLGVYVVGLVAMLLRGWNRREQPTLGGRYGAPALAVVTLVAVGVALVFLRGRPTRQGVPDTGRAAVQPVAPADLPALGYLPADVNLVVGLHVAEALDTSTGPDLLRRLSVGPFSSRALASWTGLELDELDHLALGANVREALPRVTLVARTRRPYDADKVRSTLKARRTPEPGLSRPVHKLTDFDTGVTLLNGMGAYLWCADESTLVLHFSPNWEAVPLTPGGGDRFAEPLVRFLRQRLGPSAQAWAAGHVDSWDKGGIQLAIALLPAPEQAIVRGLRTLGAWLVCDDGAILNASFRCADEAAAVSLQKWLDGGDERKGLKALATDAGSLGGEFAKTLRTSRDGPSVDVQAKASAEAVRPR